MQKKGIVFILINTHFDLLLQVFFWSLICPVIQEAGVALNDRAARQLEQSSQPGTAGPQHYLPNSLTRITSRVLGLQTPASSRQSLLGLQTPGSSRQSQAPRAHWREGRGQRRRQGPNLLQRLLQPINRVAAMG